MLSILDIEAAVVPLAKKYNIRSVGLFGSYAENKATESSDADFLVEFNQTPPSIFEVMGFKAELQAELNLYVDVVTLPAPRPDLLAIGKTINLYG